MPRQRRSPSNTTNIQGSKAAQKENEKLPESKLEHIEIYDINNREFRIAVLKILNKMQENIDRQFNVFKKQIKQNEYFIKEIETLKNNHIEILEIRNKLLSKGNRADQR